MKKLNNVSNLVVLTIAFVLGVFDATTVQAAGPAAIDLGSAGNFVILTKSGISTTGATSVVGNIGVSPINATAITGFGLNLTTGSDFATSALVSGKVYAADYAVPTPATMTTAISDMQTAYTNGAGRTNPTATELGAGNIGGMTLAPGFYKWSTGVTIPSDVTLSGSANDVWIFVIGQNLDLAPGKKIILSGGAQESNIFWIVAGQTTLGTTSVFSGNILDQTAIVLNTGARLNGRALAQTAVTLDANTVSIAKNNNSTPSTPKDVCENLAGNQTDVPNGYTKTSNGECIKDVVESTPNSNPNRATPAIPATPAVPGQSPAIPATPATPSASHFNLGIRLLGHWSVGEDVKELQRFLNTKINFGLKVDGILGPITTVGLKKWQKENGLNADGMVGIKTRTKIGIEVQ